MRLLYIIAIICISIACHAQDISVMSFNIRYDNPADSPNHWLARKDHLASQILFHDATIVGVQEALDHQVKQLQQLLPGYAFFGVGRDDGKTKGEYSGIYYQKNVLELLEQHTFWLSLTPEVAGSKSWDAAITRVVTWGRFRHRKSGKICYHFNTHFDHIGKEARRNSAQLLVEKIAQIAGNNNVVVTGDFNAHPQDEPMQVILDKASPIHLTDSKSISQAPHYGPGGTFNAFQTSEKDKEPIDYILLKGNWQVLKHATISQSWEGRFASDHFAVLALLRLP